MKEVIEVMRGDVRFGVDVWRMVVVVVGIEVVEFVDGVLIVVKL